MLLRPTVGTTLKALHNEERFDHVVIVGNYAFDSFPVDILVHDKSGILYEVGAGNNDHTCRAIRPHWDSNNKQQVDGETFHEVGEGSGFASKVAAQYFRSLPVERRGGVYTVPVAGVCLLQVSVFICPTVLF